MSGFRDIPILDLSLAENPQTKPDLLVCLRHALTDIGFMYIVNHRVPEPVIAALVEALPVLFCLPAPAKEEISLRNSPHFLGYSGEGSEVCWSNCYVFQVLADR
jgi:isopenicillin N synthase-like dioxygenase